MQTFLIYPKLISVHILYIYITYIWDLYGTPILTILYNNVSIEPVMRYGVQRWSFGFGFMMMLLFRSRMVISSVLLTAFSQGAGPSSAKSPPQHPTVGQNARVIGTY